VRHSALIAPQQKSGGVCRDGSDSAFRRSLPHDRFGSPERTWPDHLV